MGNIQVGCSLYVLINKYLRMEFVIPFRITLPEMDPKMCAATKSKESACDAGPYLRASFTISMDLNVYMGLKVDLGRIVGLVKQLIMKRKGGLIRGPTEEKLIKGPIPIIKKMSLGCVQLKGLLSILNKLFHPKCCAPGGGDHGYTQYGDEGEEIAEQGAEGGNEGGHSDYGGGGGGVLNVGNGHHGGDDHHGGDGHGGGQHSKGYNGPNPNHFGRHQQRQQTQMIQNMMMMMQQMMLQQTQPSMNRYGHYGNAMHRMPSYQYRQPAAPMYSSYHSMNPYSAPHSYARPHWNMGWS